MSRITKYCHLFLDGEDGYVYLTTLGYGRASQAQLVLHIPTCELRVRKVSHFHLDREATEIEDSEKLLFSLQEQAIKQGVQPHISYLYSASDVPAAGTKAEDCELWSRISYSKYYNGGTVGDLYRAYVNMAQAIPSTTIWRLMTQLLDALHFVSTCGEGILHADVRDENIFLHYEGAKGANPDFYLGDFGNAEHGSLADPTRYGNDVKNLIFYLHRWLMVCPVPDPSERDRLWKYLYFVVLPALRALPAHGQLPDLKPVMKLLRKAPTGPPESLPEWMDRRDEYEGLPMFYTFEDECLGVDGVNGPWYAARVRIEVQKRRFKVLDISTKTYSTAGLGPDVDSGPDVASGPDSGSGSSDPPSSRRKWYSPACEISDERYAEEKRQRAAALIDYMNGK